MHIADIILWFSVFLILYTYLLYPFVLFFAYTFVQLGRDIGYLNRRRNRRAPTQIRDELPGVTMIVPVYNEGEHLAEKNCESSRDRLPSRKASSDFCIRWIDRP